jgi:hypothetical protein
MLCFAEPLFTKKMFIYMVFNVIMEIINSNELKTIKQKESLLWQSILH